MAEKPGEDWWRSALWLSAWIVLPAYGFFYCRSFDDPASPKDWILAAAGLWGSHWYYILAATVAVAAAATYFRKFAIVIGAVAVSLVFAEIVVCAVCPAETIATVFSNKVFFYGTLVLLPATVWAFAGVTIRERLIKALQLVLIVSLVLGVCAIAHIVWDQLRAESIAKHPDLPWRSIWHTRYIGIVWPAVWIGAAALICRLPTRPLRWIVVILIVGTNLANASGRVIAQLQIPYDRAFNEIALSKPGAKVRTYFRLTNSLFGGDGLPNSDYWRPMAAYNACVAERIKTSPPDFREGKTWPFVYGPVMERFKQMVVYRPFVDADSITADVVKSPELTRIIIWQDGEGNSPTDSNLIAKLGENWRLVKDEVIPHYWYWDWGVRGECRRTEYAR